MEFNKPFKEQIIFEQIYDGKDYLLRLKSGDRIIAESKNEKGALWCLMKVLVLFEQGEYLCGCDTGIGQSINAYWITQVNKNTNSKTTIMANLIEQIKDKALELGALLEKAEKQGLKVEIGINKDSFGCGNSYFTLKISTETVLLKEVVSGQDGQNMDQHICDEHNQYRRPTFFEQSRLREMKVEVSLRSLQSFQDKIPNKVDTQ